MRNIDWEAGDRARQDLVQRGLLRPSHNGKDRDGGGKADAVSDDIPQLDDLADRYSGGCGFQGGGSRWITIPFTSP